MGVNRKNKPLRNILALIAVHLLLLPRPCQEIQEQPVEQPAEDKKQLIDLSSSTADASHRVGSNLPDGRREGSSSLVTDDVKQATLDHHGNGIGSIGQAVITLQGTTEHGTTLQDLSGHDPELRLPLAQHLTPGARSCSSFHFNALYSEVAAWPSATSWMRQTALSVTLQVFRRRWRSLAATQT